MNTPTTPTFHKHGKDWFPHRPGDPMPCDGRTKVFTHQRYEAERGQCINMAGPALLWPWESTDEDAVLGWRYADPQPEIAESAPDELVRLREENANMRALITECRQVLNRLDHAKFCRWTTGSMCNCGLSETFAKLQPFTQP